MIQTAAIIQLIGGARATLFLSLAVVMAAGLGIQTVRLNASQASYEAYKDKVVAATAKAQVAAAQAAEKAAIAREEYYRVSAVAESNYQAGRESAIAYQNTVIADLRSGNLKLRNEWAGCMRAPKDEAASGTASGSDGAADVPPEAFGRILRVGADADNAVQWYQAELTATRALYSQCATGK